MKLSSKFILTTAYFNLGDGMKKYDCPAYFDLHDSRFEIVKFVFLN